jgi:hypothetical protein
MGKIREKARVNVVIRHLSRKQQGEGGCLGKAVLTPSMAPAPCPCLPTPSAAGFNDDDYLGFFAFFSLPPNPLTLLQLALLVFLAAEPFLQLALLQKFNNGDYLGFFCIVVCHRTLSAAGSP